MDKSIESLSGIEFENLCQQLLQKMEFKTQITKASGDGGIDIIATYDKPLLKGKYIIQCKRYAGSVGEPIIRDLYGVVMSERANKGILMTTGYFTPSAISFAEGKPIELIDGSELQILMSDNDFSFDPDDTKRIVTSFTGLDYFDMENYTYLKDSVTRFPKNEALALSLLLFYFEYLADESVDCLGNDNNNLKNISYDEKYEIAHLGLAREFYLYSQNFINTFFSRGKVKKILGRRYSYKYLGIAMLYCFDFHEYVLDRLEILQMGTINDSLSTVSIYKWAEQTNLYSVFNILGIESGINFIRKWMKKSRSTIYIRKKGQGVNVDRDKFFNDIENGKFMILYPNINTDREEKTVFASYDYYIDLTDYYMKYKQEYQQKIDSEITKIKILLDTL